MHRVTFDLETITPMFMYGADGTTPELRAPSFKGMLRFWWRALNYSENYFELGTKEAELFGGTEEKQGKSNVTIKVYPQPSQNHIEQKLWSVISANQYDKNKFSSTTQSNGIFYLLYSTLLPNREKALIQEGFQFSLQFNFINEKSLKHSIAAFWSAVYCGGFGTRSRRGGGNITILKIREGDESADEEIGEISLKFKPKVEGGQELSEWLKTNLNRAIITVNNREKFQTTELNHSNLIGSKIIVSKQSFQGWQTALNEVGDFFSSFRKSHQNEIYDTAVFGLPIMHRKKRITVKAKYGSNIINHRSSPLIFKIIKSQNKYYWMVIRLSGKFLPEGSVIIAKETKKPDLHLLDHFWEQLSEHGHKISL